jgi:hypothetical protein
MRKAKKARTVKAVPIDTDDPRLGEQIQATLRQLWTAPDEATVRPLYFPGDKQVLLGYAAEAVLMQLLRPRTRSFKRILRFLGIAHDRDGFHSLSPYALSEILYARFDSNDRLIHDVSEAFGIRPDSIDLLFCAFSSNNPMCVFAPEYRELLFRRRLAFDRTGARRMPL